MGYDESSHGKDENGAQPVDLTDVRMPEGFSFYGSTKPEQNSRSVNITATSSVWYTPPTDMPLSKAIDLYEQVLSAISDRTWNVANARKASLESGTDMSLDFEVDLITGEIKEEDRKKSLPRDPDAVPDKMRVNRSTPKKAESAVEEPKKSAVEKLAELEKSLDEPKSADVEPTPAPIAETLDDLPF